MKRGKDEEKTMGSMFPRLHVNDTEKGGPRAPPRNKMALYEQLSIPSERFNGGVSPLNPNSMANSLLQSSSTPGIIRKSVQQEHDRRQEDDDFRVPICDQQSGTSQNRSINHQRRANKASSGRLVNIHGKQSNKPRKENSQESAKSPSNQTPRQTNKVPLKEANEYSSFSHRDGSNDSRRLQSNGNLRDYRGVDKTLWGDNVVNPVREVQQETSRSPDADAVSETSMVDSMCGVDLSPDDVVGIIGQKHFWQARRLILNQQRVFSVQVFELHRLIKVQRLIAGSPHLLVEENAYLVKPPKVSPIKEKLLKPTLNTAKHKTEKPNEDTDFSGKASLSSVQNGSQATYCGNPLPQCEPNTGSWNFNLPPGHQWLVPVMSPSEGLVYKPYPAPGFMNPLYGGCRPPGSTPTVFHPFAAPANHAYFPAYSMSMVNPQQQGSNNVSMEKNRPSVPLMVKVNNLASKDNGVQVSTASSRNDRTPAAAPVRAPEHVEAVERSRAIRVVPYNAGSATASVARIFKSIQEERKQYDSG